MLKELISVLDIKQEKPFKGVSVNEIAKQLDISKRTAQNYLRNWREIGFISEVEQFDPSTKKPTQYRINSRLF